MSEEVGGLVSELEKALPNSETRVYVNRARSILEIEAIAGELGGVPGFEVFKTGAAFGLDFGLGYLFQLYDDRQNPYLSPGGRQTRAIISGIGGGLFSLGAGVLAVEAGVCLATSLVCLATVGTLSGLAWAVTQPPVLELLDPFIFKILGVHTISIRDLVH